MPSDGKTCIGPSNDVLNWGGVHIGATWQIRLNDPRAAAITGATAIQDYVAAVPPRPQDGTVSVIVLFTIVFGCVTDCYCNL